MGFFLNKTRNNMPRFLSKKNQFLIIAIVFFIFFCSVIIYAIYQSSKDEFEQQASIEAHRIDNILTNIFDETNHIMVFIGQQIDEHNPEDLEFIEKLLVQSSQIASKTESMYSWPLFDWVGANGDMLVNSKIGILENPVDVSHHEYTWKSPKHPDILQLSHPTIGNPSGMWVVPAGTGIKNKQGKYIGALAVGFDVSELNSKIEQSLGTKNVSFIVLDEDLRIILQSTNNAIDPKSSYYHDLLPSSKYFAGNNQRLTEPIHYKNIIYSQYRRIDKYPYIILTGFEKGIINHKIQSLIFPRILEFLIMGCFCLILFYLSKRKFLKLVQASNFAKDRFLRRLNSEMRTSVACILTNSNVLLRYLKGQIDVGISRERQIEFMHKIHEEAFKLNTLTTDMLDLCYIDTNEIIEEAITIHYPIVLEKNIKIKSFLNPHLPFLYADELRFKQIIVGLLSLVCEYNPRKTTIKISSLKRTIVGKEFLILKFKDNGFNFSREDIRRFSERIDHTNQKENGISLEFSTIEKLVHSHRGRCFIINKWEDENRGKTVYIIIPYNTKEGLETPTPPSNKKNILNFDKIRKRLSSNYILPKTIH